MLLQLSPFDVYRLNVTLHYTHLCRNVWTSRIAFEVWNFPNLAVHYALYLAYVDIKRILMSPDTHLNIGV